MLHVTRNNPRALLKLIAEQQDTIYDLQTKLSNKEAIIERVRDFINLYGSRIGLDDDKKQFIYYGSLPERQVKELVDILDKEVK
jgi:hypothetical protein